MDRRNLKLGRGKPPKPTPTGGEKGPFGNWIRRWIEKRTCDCVHTGTLEIFQTNQGSHDDCTGACAGGQGVWVGSGGGGGSLINRSSPFWRRLKNRKNRYR